MHISVLCLCFPPSSAHFSSPPPSFPFLFLVSSFLLLFFKFLISNPLFSSSCHCCALSLSWDSFYVVRHNEIPLNLGQFSVWRLILHEPISRARRHTRTCTQAHVQQTHTLHLFIMQPVLPSPMKDMQTHTHKRGILILLFYHAGKERGERHHGYDPPGAE